MSLQKSAFDGLVAALRGSRVHALPWDEVLALSNHALVTPSLARVLIDSGQIAGLSADVRVYLLFVLHQNDERNARLRSQLYEVIAALNEIGIAPLLLKGAVPLFLCRREKLPSRMTSDLDIAVEASELARAQARLTALGFEAMAGVDGLARPQDVGLLELKSVQPHGGPDPALVERDGFQARIPPAISRARHWIMHDLIKEADYLRGRLDLRHLYDLVELSRHEKMDWAALRESLPDRLSLDAFDVQMLALHDLFGVSVPPSCLRSPVIRFHHWRRIFPVLYPTAGAPLRVAGNLWWGAGQMYRIPVLLRRHPLEPLRRAKRASLAMRPHSKL